MNLQKHVSLNINVRGLGESPTLAINERVKLLQGQGKKIYNFGLGQSPFPVPAPVVEAKALASRQPVAVFSNLVFAFWSPVSLSCHSR